MLIEFTIPSGTMKLYAEEFFKDAGFGKIRKMIKLMFEAEACNVTSVELCKWLQDRAGEERTKAAGSAVNYTTSSTLKKKTEEQYAHMMSPCYLDFTQDKAALKEARNRVTSAGRRAGAYKREYEKAIRLMDRYQKTANILRG